MIQPSVQPKLPCWRELLTSERSPPSLKGKGLVQTAACAPNPTNWVNIFFIIWCLLKVRRRSQISVDILLIVKIRIHRGWIGSHWWLSASLLCTAEGALWLQVFFCALDSKCFWWRRIGRLNTLRWCRPFLDPSIFSLSSHRERDVFLYSQRKLSRSQTRRYQHQSCTFSTCSKPGTEEFRFWENQFNLKPQVPCSMQCQFACMHRNSQPRHEKLYEQHKFWFQIFLQRILD